MDFPRRTRTRVFVFYFSKVQYYIKKRRRGRRTSLGSSFTCGLSSVERSTCVGRKEEGSCLRFIAGGRGSFNVP